MEMKTLQNPSNLSKVSKLETTEDRIQVTAL